MAKAIVVNKDLRVDLESIIKYQLITHCFFNDIKLSENELNCLVLLAHNDEPELSNFCNLAVELNIFKTAQTVRNFFTKAQKENLIEKKGSSKKRIFLSKELNIQTQGIILLKYNIIYAP